MVLLRVLTRRSAAWRRSGWAILLSASIGLSGCTGLFFQPSTVLVRTPADIGLAYEPVQLTTSDGVRLASWFLPAMGQPKGTVLFLHGNAENISTHIGAVRWMPSAGFNVLLLDYRGYGQSGGAPTLDGVQRDIDAAVRHLLERADVDASRIVLIGQSLGGALATWYAARGPHRRVFRAVIVDSAFSSYRDIAREKLGMHWLTGWLQWPAGFTVDDSFSPIRVVGDVAPTPLLLIVGGRDSIVPAHHGERLFAAASAPKALWRFPEASHIGAINTAEARARLIAYLGECLSAPPSRVVNEPRKP